MKRFTAGIICLLLLVGTSSTISAIVAGRGRGVLQRGSGAVATPYYTNGIAPLYGWWNMETTNTTATLSITNNRPATRLPNVATGPTWTEAGANVNGVMNHSYYFDGVDDALYYGAAQDWWVNMFSAWIYHTGAASTRTIMRISNSDGSRGYALRLGPESKLNLLIYDQTAYRTCTGSNAIPSNVWVHVAGMHNWSSNPDMILYTNGVLDSSAVLLGAAPGYGVDRMYIGSQFNGANNFKGYIDDVMIVSNDYPAVGLLNTYISNSIPTNYLTTL